MSDGDEMSLCAWRLVDKSVELTARGVDLDAKVELNELVEARQHTSASDTSQNVGTGTLHE